MDSHLLLRFFFIGRPTSTTRSQQAKGGCAGPYRRSARGRLHCRLSGSALGRSRRRARAGAWKNEGGRPALRQPLLAAKSWGEARARKKGQMGGCVGYGRMESGRGGALLLPGDLGVASDPSPHHGEGNGAKTPPSFARMRLESSSKKKRILDFKNPFNYFIALK
jgi:hypothetical protein